MTTAVFGLLLAVVFAHIWFASTPLPFGGPNVLLAALASFGAAVCFVAPVLTAERGAQGTVLVERLRRLRPVGAVLVVGGLLFAWALIVSAVNDNWDYPLLGKMAFGLAVFCAVFLTVDSVRRAKALVLAMPLAIAGSAGFGALVLAFGEPFLGLWLWIATVPDEQLALLSHGASSGLASHPSTFGNQLSVAIPMALCAVVWAAHRGSARWGVPRIAALFFIFAVLTTMLLVNGSRSSVVGAVAGVGAAAWLWMRGGTGRRRTLVVFASTGIAVAALWIGLVWTGVLGAPPSSLGRIAGILASNDALVGNDGWVGHRFNGLAPGARYEVALAEQYMLGHGPWTRATATADSEGGMVLAWRPSAHDRTLGYRFRALPLHRGHRSHISDEYVVPSLPTRAPPRLCADQRPSQSHLRLALRDVDAAKLTLGVGRQGLWREGDLWTAMERTAVAQMSNLVGGVVRLPGVTELTVEIRACAGDGFGRAADVGVTPNPGEPAVLLTWREPETSAPLEYQFRSRPSGQSTWSDWRMVRPVRYARGPLFGTIGVGGRALVSGPSAVGHEFRGLVHSQFVVVHIRTRRANHFDPPMEVVAKADIRGRLVLVWAEPDDPASVSGHQFRLRVAASDEWSPWRDFQPTLSSQAPTPQPMPADAHGEDVRRHTLTGLVPGFVHRVQLRARNEHGYGAESTAFSHPVEDDGGLPLTWRDTGGSSPATGYQFRLWQGGTYQWWQDVTPQAERTPAETVDHLRSSQDEQWRFAHTARDLAGGRVAAQRRLSLTMLLNPSAYARLWQVPLAWRYTLEHPLGTGKFSPKRRHMGDGSERAWADGYAPEEPHNQFLHMLVLFGVPALLLYIGFYALVARTVIRCAKLAARPPTLALRFLCAAAVGACVAYFASSMLLPAGPLLHDWDHFLLIGLLFCLPRIAGRTSNTQAVLRLDTNAPTGRTLGRRG